jgi:hypothetical protein
MPLLRRREMSGQQKARSVYQERMAHRQAVERLRRVYAKLIKPEALEKNRSKPKPSIQPYQEEQQ